MNVDREIIESVVRLLEKAMNAECDAFGVDHNEATDLISSLEYILKEEK